MKTENKLPNVTLTTDGGCEPNPGTGAWAAILRYGRSVRTLTGLERHTTNNRMELRAIIAGLSALTKSCAVTLRTDSQLCIWAIEAAHVPKKRRKYEAKGKNMDLVRELWEVAARHHLSLVWVKGHSGDTDNEACDQLCAAAIQAADSDVKTPTMPA